MTRAISKRCRARPARELAAAAMANACGYNAANRASESSPVSSGVSEFIIAFRVCIDGNPGYPVFYPYTTGGNCLMVPLAGWLLLEEPSILNVPPKPLG
jgi:hypothetical protein